MLLMPSKQDRFYVGAIPGAGQQLNVTVLCDELKLYPEVRVEQFFAQAMQKKTLLLTIFADSRKVLVDNVAKRAY